MKYSTLILTAIIGWGARGASATGPAYTAETGAGWVGNITRSPFIGAAHDAMRYDVIGAAGWRDQISRDVSWQFDAKAGYESCPKYEGLDRLFAGLQFSVRRKFGLGPLAPSIRAEVSCTGDSYRESPRDSTRLGVSLAWARRWGESCQTVVTAEGLRHDGRLAAYDYRNCGLAAETHCDLTENWQLTAGIRRQWGGQLTYAWLGGSGASFPYVFAIWKNTAAIPTFGRNWSAYSIDAHADSAWLGLSLALGANRALPLRFEQTAVVGRGESYRCRLISLRFVQRF